MTNIDLSIKQFSDQCLEQFRIDTPQKHHTSINLNYKFILSIVSVNVFKIFIQFVFYRHREIKKRATRHELQ